MRITFIIQDLFQQGAQYVTALMIRGFIAKGYDVDLIVSKNHEKLLMEKNNKPFEIPEKTNLIILKDEKARKNIWEIRSYIKKGSSNAIIAMSPNYMWALAIASIGISNNTILSYVEHSGLVTIDDESNPILKWLKASFIKSRFSVIMAVSKGTARAVEKSLGLSENSVITVYNPVIDDIYNKKLHAQTQHPWLINKTIPTFIAAGAHCELKRHFILFEAIRIANKTTPVRLVLFGKGYLTNEYMNWIEDNKMNDFINIANHTDNLPAEIKSADAFIISSEVESFSIVLVEAMAAGVPIISTNCKYGPPELLDNGKYGKLVPINNSKAMAEAIIAHIRKPIKPAPKESWSKFTLDNVVSAYEKALGLK